MSIARRAYSGWDWQQTSSSPAASAPGLAIPRRYSRPDSRYRRRRVLHLRSRRCLARADDHGLDRDRLFGRRGPAAAGMLVSAAGTALRLFAPDTTRKELTDFVGQKAG